MRTSEARASARPPPAAGPLTAEITTCGSARSLGTSAAMYFCRARPVCGERTARSGPPMSNAVRSSPAQNPRPAPVSTSTRTDGSAARASSTACSSRRRSADSALSRSGRSRVRTTMPGSGEASRRVVRSVGSPAGSGACEVVVTGYLSAAGALVEGDVLLGVRVLGQPEQPLGDDVALDLRGAPGDAGLLHRQEVVGRRVERRARRPAQHADRVGLGGEHAGLLLQPGADQLADRPLRADRA